MSETIPEDVLTQARDDFTRFISPSPTAFDAFNTSLIVHGIARAILSERDRATAAERERCAGLAEDAAEQALRALGGFTASNAAFFMEGKFRALLAAIRNPMEGRG